MAKNSISDWDTTAGNNTDVGGVGIAGTTTIRSGDNAFREIMSQVADYFITNGTLASAATLNLDSVDNLTLEITGTTSVTAVTLAEGHKRIARAAAAFTLTAGASLIVNGSLVTDYTTVAGDILFFQGYGSSVVRVWVLRGMGNGAAAFPKGHIHGLKLSNNGTDATNDIDIAAGECRDGSDVANMVLASSLTKRLDAAWAFGDGNGGLDTGSIADTTYHVWLIGRSDTGVIDALFSASATSPTMPANYDQKRRIGAFTRESSTIVPFTQLGDQFLRQTPLFTGATSTTSATLTVATGAPIGIQVDLLLSGRVVHSTDAVAVLIMSPDQADVAPVAGGINTVQTEAGLVGSYQQAVRCDTSGRVRHRSTSTSTAVGLGMLGWIDSRGRYD